MFYLTEKVKLIEYYEIQIKNGKMIKVDVSIKIIVGAEKDYSWNTSTCIHENSRYSKSTADGSVIVCN